MKLKRRDTVIAKVVGFLFRFASDDYRNFIRGAMIYGLNAVAQDTADQQPVVNRGELVFPAKTPYDIP